jgi:hypothetical protein
MALVSAARVLSVGRAKLLSLSSLLASDDL